MRQTRQCALGLVLAAWLAPGLAHASGVAIVADNALNVYRRVTTGFTVEVRRQVVEYSLDGKRERGKEVFAAALSGKPDLFLAIGPIAATLARELVPKEIPVIFCMVPNLEQYPDLKGPNITGVALELSIRDQLATLKTVAPKTQSVGVVFNPKHTAKKIEEAKVAAGELGLKLVTAEAAAPTDVARAVSSLEKRIDALWMIPDKTVLDLDAFKSLLDFSLKKKIPFFSLNSKFVEKGALCSLSIDYMRVGQQAGELAKRILDEKVAPASVPVRSPEGLEIAINLTTAREIGVQCDLALEVFTFAAEKRFAINVFK